MVNAPLDWFIAFKCSKEKYMGKGNKREDAIEENMIDGKQSWADMSREGRNKELMECVEWNNDHSSSNVSFSRFNRSKTFFSFLSAVFSINLFWICKPSTPSRMDTVCSNGHPLDRMRAKSLLPQSIISAVLSWRDAIWRLYLSPLTLLHCPVQFLTSLSRLSLSRPFTLPSLPPFSAWFLHLDAFVSTLLVPLPLYLLEHTDVHTHTAQLALLPPIFSGPDLFHERECCQWARHLSFHLPPSSPCAHVCLWFLFLFLPLSSAQSAFSVEQMQLKRYSWEVAYGSSWILCKFSKWYPQCSES